MKAIALGAHILDVLGKYVTEIPEGQGGALIDEIRLSPAGAAGGTAVILSKLGAHVLSVGAVGQDDAGDVLVSMLQRFGVDCENLARRDGVQTSCTILPIRPTGERPALHVIGANATIDPDELPWDEIADADFLHVGGPEFLGPDNAVRILEFCREHDVTTSADILADGWPELLDMLAPALPLLDYLLPNEDQAMALTGEGDPVAAGKRLLDHGVGAVALTAGEKGSILVSPEGSLTVPAFEVEVVDTTGCGDGYSAGFLRGLSLGHDTERAATIGSATAAQVAQGLGTDAGDYDLDRVLEFADSAPKLATA
ncbi:MAG: carbohydrate kinase family protein [Thermoleophilaceae bacterium]